MPLQMALLVGAVMTVSTLIWLFACVDSDMPFQIYFLYSTVWTVGAGKRFLPCVSAQVSCETDGNISAVCTAWALIRVVSSEVTLPEVLSFIPCIVHIHLLGIFILLIILSELLFIKYIRRKIDNKICAYNNAIVN